MAEIDYNDIVKNVAVYGMDESIRRSKYPMSVDVGSTTADVTPTTIKIAQCERGSGHDQFLTGIIVQFDLTFTVKAWTEAERYHFFDFVSSQSTMHRITKFEVADQYIRYVDPLIVEIMKGKVSFYNLLKDGYGTDPTPEQQRELEEAYLGILYSNPTGFRLTAGMTTNYRQLKTIYAQRKNHRLPEWRAFCKWIETLPHSEFITGGKND